MIRVTDKQYWMDDYLRSNLNTIAYNLPNDWSSIMIVSGSGKVRVGKSVIAQQIAYYISQKLNTKFDINNIVFSGEDLTKVAKTLPKNSVIIYDEARGELDTKKVMQSMTKGLLDFFAECGAYNHLVILCMPDYFEMPKQIAINQSECLINTLKLAEETKDGNGEAVLKWERGIFEFYNERGKKILYELGKKNHNNYDIGKKYRSFFGEFPNFYCVGEEEYKLKKRMFMMRDRLRTKKGDERLSVALRLLNKFMTQREMEKEFSYLGVDFSQERINQIIGFSKENKLLINDKCNKILTQEAPSVEITKQGDNDAE